MTAALSLNAQQTLGRSLLAMPLRLIQIPEKKKRATGAPFASAIVNFPTLYKLLMIHIKY
jgi:hypothetical protein